MTQIHKALNVIEYVEENYPDHLKFTVDRETLRQIGLYLHLNNKNAYHTFILLFGILFFLAILEYFCENEEYEVCKIMVETIQEVNQQYGWEFPTTVEDRLIKQWRNLSPLELLEQLNNGSELPTV